MEPKISSSSSGVAVRSSPSVALFWSCSPPLYAGVSWMNRSPTIEGEMTAAFASAGTFCSPS